MKQFITLLVAVSCTITACNNKINGYEYVDFGLSVKWATCNVGATLPADYGSYYAWGEIKTKPNDCFDWDKCVTWLDTSIVDFSGDAKYDAATANWGGSWRTPTADEWQELIDSCTITATILVNSDNKMARVVRIEGPSGNSIFLPLAGFHGFKSMYYFGEDMYNPHLFYEGSNGYYWSSTYWSGTNILFSGMDKEKYAVQFEATTLYDFVGVGTV